MRKLNSKGQNPGRCSGRSNRLRQDGRKDGAPGGGNSMCGIPQVTCMGTDKQASMVAAVETEGRIAQREAGKDNGAA